MTKDQIITYLFISFGMVLAARLFGTMISAWMGDIFSKKDTKSLDELIHEQRNFVGGVRATTAPPHKESSKEDLLQIERTLTPEEEKKSKILHRIYDFDYKKKPEEEQQVFFRRVLGVQEGETVEMIKKNYREKSKDFHPDRFDLSLFDKKMKKKLEERIHQNYLVVQKAYQVLLKSAKSK